MAVFGQCFLVFRFFAVQLCTRPKNGFDAMRVGAVRVVHGFALGVVLAVNSDPFLGDLSSAQPQPKAEKVRHGRM